MDNIDFNWRTSDPIGTKITDAKTKIEEGISKKDDSLIEEGTNELSEAVNRIEEKAFAEAILNAAKDENDKDKVKFHQAIDDFEKYIKGKKAIEENGNS